MELLKSIFSKGWKTTAVAAVTGIVWFLHHQTMLSTDVTNNLLFFLVMILGVLTKDADKTGTGGTP